MLHNKTTMPIKSYLAHPIKGKKEVLLKALKSFNNCDVIPSENKELLIVVTDTQTIEEDKRLKEKLDTIESLKFLSLVSGFNTPKK